MFASLETEDQSRSSIEDWLELAHQVGQQVDQYTIPVVQSGVHQGNHHHLKSGRGTHLWIWRSRRSEAKHRDTVYFIHAPASTGRNQCINAEITYTVETGETEASVNQQWWSRQAMLSSNSRARGRWKCRSGNCRSGKYGSENVWKTVRTENKNSHQLIITDSRNGLS